MNQLPIACSTEMITGITLPLNQSTKLRITSPMNWKTTSMMFLNQSRLLYAKMSAPIIKPKMPSQPHVANVRPKIVVVWRLVIACQAAVAAVETVIAACHTLNAATEIRMPSANGPQILTLSTTNLMIFPRFSPKSYRNLFVSSFGLIPTRPSKTSLMPLPMSLRTGKTSSRSTGRMESTKYALTFS